MVSAKPATTSSRMPVLQPREAPVRAFRTPAERSAACTAGGRGLSMVIRQLDGAACNQANERTAAGRRFQAIRQLEFDAPNVNHSRPDFWHDLFGKPVSTFPD